MTRTPLDIVVLGLSLSSSWGNGHATTYRALLRGLANLGHRVTFLEREVPWYAGNRDMENPDFCRLFLYDGVADLHSRFRGEVARADAVIVGSYVPDGVAVLDLALAWASGTCAFYDIDTPVTLAALERDTCQYLARRQVPELDLYFSFTGGPTLGHLAAEFGARRPRALYCSVDETLYRPHHVAPRWDLGYLGTYSADRQPALERLLIEPARRLPGHRFVVAGAQYPAGIRWPANVERIEHLPPALHARFYSQQRFTLNVTRADMVAAGWSPSVRLFEAGACMTPIISDRWRGLGDFLPEDQAVLVADRADQVIALLEEKDDARRRDVARTAHRIVLGGHTGTARARQLQAALIEAALPDRTGTLAPPEPVSARPPARPNLTTGDRP